MKTATIPEIAREKNCSRQALEAFRNVNGVKPAGKRGRTDLYNVSDFTNFGKTKKERGDWHLRWEKARAEKLEIENAKRLGELLDRTMAVQVFSEIYAIIRAQFLETGAAQADTVCAEAAIKDPAMKLRIQQRLDKAAYSALENIKISVDKFLEKVESEPIAESMKPPKKKQRMKPKQQTQSTGRKQKS